MNDKRVKFLFHTIKHDFWDPSVTDEKHQQEIKKEFTIARKLLISYSFLGTFLATSSIYFPIFELADSERRLPFLLWAPFDVRPSPIYEVAYVFAALSVLLSLCGHFAFDILFFYCAEHMCIQFKILKNLVENLTRDVLSNDDYDLVQKFHSKRFQQIVKARIDICIRQHSILLKFAKEFETLTSSVLAIQCTTTFFGLALSGFLVTDDSVDQAQKMFILFLCNCYSIQIFIFCLFGSYITSQGFLIFDAAYNCDWYLLNSKLRKDLKFIGTRAMLPVRLTCLGLIEVNNELIIEMYQKVFSIITLLQSVGEEQQ